MPALRTRTKGAYFHAMKGFPFVMTIYDNRLFMESSAEQRGNNVQT